MTVYDPDADRLEDIEQSGDNETVICYAYSRKTGAPIEPLAIEDVSRTLTNNNQFIWLDYTIPVLKPFKRFKMHLTSHELALEDALLITDAQRLKATVMIPSLWLCVLLSGDNPNSAIAI